MTERTTVPFPNVLCDDCDGRGFYEDIEDGIGVIQTPCESCGSARCEMELDHDKPTDLPGESKERIDLYFDLHRMSPAGPSIRLRGEKRNTPAVDATFCSHECFERYIDAGPTATSDIRKAANVIETISYSLLNLPPGHRSRNVLIATGWTLLHAWQAELEDQIRHARNSLDV